MPKKIKDNCLTLKKEKKLLIISIYLKNMNHMGYKLHINHSCQGKDRVTEDLHLSLCSSVLFSTVIRNSETAFRLWPLLTLCLQESNKADTGRISAFLLSVNFLIPQFLSVSSQYSETHFV